LEADEHFNLIASDVACVVAREGLMLGRLLTNAARNLANTRFASRIIEGIDLHSDNRLGERGMLAQAFEFKKINNIPGDYFEFGLWRGKTFRYAHEMKRRYRCDDLRLWGFDSFEGLPQIDDSHDNIWTPGQFACSEAELRKILRKAGVREHEYELVPGYYERSLNADLHHRLTGRSAAIIYIDCDLYVSTKHVLNFVQRYLVNGTIVCFDDFYNYKGSPDQGEQKALSEFLVQNSELNFIAWSAFSPLGKSFIVRLTDGHSE
jgi:O-methyltransferase